MESGGTGILSVPSKVWLDENYDRIIRDNKEFQGEMNYIRNNPAKTNLVEAAKDYKWLYILD